MTLDMRNLDHGFDVSVGDVGVSIRSSSKWSKINQGELINLVEQYSDGKESTKVGEGVIIGKWVGEFRSLPPALISIEHSNDFKNKDYLSSILNNVYHGSFHEEAIVTAVIYYRTS